jgi:hypothetical protein
MSRRKNTSAKTFMIGSNVLVGKPKKEVLYIKSKMDPAKGAKHLVIFSSICDCNLLFEKKFKKEFNDSQ